MEHGGHIAGCDPNPGKARNDYYVRLTSGRLAVIDLKGCLDGENTHKFERQGDADEPRRNTWSGIHTRLSAGMISRDKRVDGVVIWDMICGTLGRPCPKLAALDPAARKTAVGPFLTPPPCIYVFPGAIPSRAQPMASAQALDQVEPAEVNYVDFEVAEQADELLPRTVIRRGGVVVTASELTAIRRV